MAATAEALLNTLAGGSEDGSSTDSGVVQQQPSSGGPESDQAAPGGDQGGRAVVGADPADSTPPSTPAPADPGAKPDQVANLNAALRQERAERKRLEQQYTELSAKIEALSKPPAKADEPPPEPDFLQDPKGYVDAAKAKLKELTEKIESDKKQQTEAQQQQQQAQETWNKVVTAEQEFAAATPDYYDAINHVRAIRAEQIKIEVRETLDRDATEQEVAQILASQEAQGAAQLIAKGKNPSKFYYEYAKTFGYKPKAAADPATSTTTIPKPDKEAVRTMGSGGAADSGGGDEPAGDSPLGGLLAAAQNEHRAQFKRRK